MIIHAVVFDIGGVLEITPSLGVDDAWERKLGLKAGDLNQRLTGAFEQRFTLDLIVVCNSRRNGYKRCVKNSFGLYTEMENRFILSIDTAA